MTTKTTVNSASNITTIFKYKMTNLFIIVKLSEI